MSKKPLSVVAESAELRLQKIELKPAQLRMLLAADRAMAEAQAAMNMVFAGICAAEGIENARIHALETSTLTVELPPE